MAEKKKTIFCCPIHGVFLERQHWGFDETLETLQDRLTCSDPSCRYEKLIKCMHYPDRVK